MRLAPIALLTFASMTLAAAPATSPAPAAPAPAAAAPAPKPRTATVSGVVSGPDGKPLAGATVRAVTLPKEPLQRPRGARPEPPKPVTGKTGTDGSFKLEGLPDGSLAVRVEAPGLAPAFADKVPSGASLTLKLKPGVAVVGRVLDLKTQRPFGGATVRAIEKDAARFGRDAAHTATTAEDGTFRIADCAAGIVQIEAIAPRTARARLENVLARAARPGETLDPATNTLYLQPGGKLAGKVTGSDGKPMEGALVSATPAEGNLFAMFRDSGSAERTDASGRYVLDGLPAGTRYNVTARKSGLTDGEAGPIAIEAGTDRQDVDLKLESGAALTFRLVTVDDAPVSETDVRVDPSGERRGRAGRAAARMAMAGLSQDQINPGPEGKFTVKNLESGTFDVTLSPADGADILKESVSLKNGETVDLGTFKVRESKSISGRVTDAHGEAVANASIGTFWMEGGRGKMRDTRSRADGSYKLAGLGDEPLGSVWVNADGYAPLEKDGLVPGDTSANFTLEKMGIVTGRVLLPEGAAPVAFKVEAHAEAKAGEERPGMRVVVNRGAPEPNRVFSDPQGSFRLESVAPGMVTIEARADGYAPTRKSGIEVRADNVADAGTLTLSPGRTVRGRVLAAKDEMPVAGATVSLSRAQGFGMRMMGSDDQEAAAITGIDGAFAIAGLESRTYSVAASQPDYSTNNGRVEVPADADVDDFVIRLSKGGILTGTVRDAQKQPVVGASVLVTKIPMGGVPQTVTTGPDGRYTIEKMAPGDYIVMRQNLGGPVMIMAGIKQATVREGETTVFDLDEVSKITLTGRVLKGGQPVSNAMLFFSKGDAPGVDMRTATSDPSGRYQVGLDEAGSYRVGVQGSGAFFSRGMSAIKLDVPDQPAPVLDITLRAAGIVGRVTDTDGKPVASAMISARPTGENPAGGAGGMNASTSGDGSYTIDNLSTGTYEVTVRASGYKSPAPSTVSIGGDSDQPVADFQLEAGRSFRGQVVDPQGNGISGASVVVAPAGSTDGGRGMPTQTDINGTFVMTAPGEGVIDITAVAPGFAAARLNGVPVPSDDQPVRLQAPRGGRVRVTALGANGAPVPGASVRYSAKPGYLGSEFASFMNAPSATGSDGASTIGPLAPGSYEVTVSSGGKRQSQAVNVGEGQEVAVSVVLP
jgi:carboxypeptidase family protein